MSDAADRTELLDLRKALAGRFSIERELGRGGMGVVYLAQDVALDRPVALKVLPRALAARPGLRERFLREARTAARLSHPNIVPIHLVDRVDDFVFFVMSFIEGPTLGQRVRQSGPVPPREATRILRDVAWALDYAHGHGIVHRDIKADNVLLEAATGRALVTDFGIAGAGAAGGGEVLGTPGYMSPEQGLGGEVDGRSDLYAVGVLGHYMLSGRLPFQGETPQATLAQQLDRPAPALADSAREVPAPLARALDRCLEKDPADRIQAAAQLADILGRLLRDRKEVPVPIRLFQEQTRESTGTFAVMGMVVLMTATVVLIVAMEGGEPFADMLPGLIMTGLLSLLPPALLGVMARRLLKAGYGHDELVRALRRDVEDRRREIAAQAGEDSALDVWAPRIGWLGTLLFGLGMLAILVPSLPVALIEALLFAGMPLALGGAGIAAIRGSLRKSVPGSRWLELWGSPVGRAVFSLAGIGLERGPASGGAYRPTELAIGMAAERLFESLPKGVRAELGEVPAVIRQLEGHAERMRDRMRELDRALDELPGPAAREAAIHVDTAAADPVDEARRARDAAERRLREVVAALERLRLELLRLHAGSADTERLTLDLAAARALADDVGRRAEAAREVDEMLGLPPRLPREADTPQPA